MLTIQFADQLTAEGGDMAGIIDVDMLVIMGTSSGGWAVLVQAETHYLMQFYKIVGERSAVYLTPADCLTRPE